MKRLTSSLLCLCALAHSSALIGEERSSGFGFGPPEVTKLDWATRSLTPADLDGDGLQDLALINNDSGKIELLYQIPQGEQLREQKKKVDLSRWDPVLEDAIFEKRGLTVGFPVFDMIVEDLNGDGRVDLAYTSGEVPLTIRYQNEDGEWIDSVEYDGFEALGWTHSIQATDVDRDGLVELFLLSSDAIRVFRETSDGTLSEPQVLFTSGENPFNLMLLDVTGDGLKDILYLSVDGKQVLAMREQVSAGQFGPESRHVMDRAARIIVPLESVGEEAPALGVVNSRSGSLEFMRLAAPADDEAEAKTALESGSPEIYPIFKNSRESASYGMGDVNGDGEEDLIVANPSEAELVLFTKQDGRFQASKAFPSFSEVSSLSVGRFYRDKREQVVVLSEAEKAMGRSLLDAVGRLSFPRQMHIGLGAPLVTYACDLDNDGFDELLIINEHEGDYRLLVAAPANRDAFDGAWDVLFEMELEGVRRKPIAILPLDIFGSARPGLMIFVPREPPVLLRPVQNEDGLAFSVFAGESSIRESFLKVLRPIETSVFDVDGDGVHELVVARTGFSRAFKVSGDELEMVDQFNARRGGDVIDAVIPLQGDGSLSKIALFVPEQREMQILERDPTRVFRYEKSIKVGSLGLQNWYRLPEPESDGGDAYLFTGEDRFWYFSNTASKRSWLVDDIYETDLEGIHYSHLAGADINKDKIPELVAIDGNEHVVDILSLEDDGYKSRMFWKVFESNMHYQGRTGAKLEPRQIVIEDLTGDGKLDLALLVHDRILIYPQQ